MHYRRQPRLTEIIHKLWAGLRWQWEQEACPTTTVVKCCDTTVVKFDSRLTFEDHVLGIVSRVSERIDILRLVKRVFVDTSVVLLVTMHVFSQSLSTVLRCVGLLLNVIFSFSSARCTRCPGFALIRLFCRCVIDVVLLPCVCCTKLIQSRIIFVQ